MRPDSVIIATTLTDANGSFGFDTTTENGMYLAISSVGCKSANVNLPCDSVIWLENSNELSETVVRASKKYVRNTSRGLQISMEGNPVAKLGNAMDAIRQLPMIDASGGGLSVLGHGSPVIYINNRLVRSTSELSTLSVEDISNVEIITNPSSKYGADVTSVILIRTKKLKDKDLLDLLIGKTVEIAIAKGIIKSRTIIVDGIRPKYQHGHRRDKGLTQQKKPQLTPRPGYDEGLDLSRPSKAAITYSPAFAVPSA